MFNKLQMSGTELTATRLSPPTLTLAQAKTRRKHTPFFNFCESHNDIPAGAGPTEPPPPGARGNQVVPLPAIAASGRASQTGAQTKKAAALDPSGTSLPPLPPANGRATASQEEAATAAAVARDAATAAAGGPPLQQRTSTPGALHAANERGSASGTAPVTTEHAHKTHILEAVVSLSWAFCYPP